jgi:hypothetical protein
VASCGPDAKRAPKKNAEAEATTGVEESISQPKDAAPPSTGRVKNKPLQTWEVLAVAAFVIALFGGIILVASLCSTSWPWPVKRPTITSVWDHPEPNFAVSEVVAEFWSVLTTFPVVGGLLLYQSLRFDYGSDVLAVAIITCVMYTNACVAHCTLHNTLFTTTVLGVCNNALYSFGQFGFVVGGWMECIKCRTRAIVAAEVLVVIALLNLPYAIGEGGGVWTLFAVQTPPVFYAWQLASYLKTAAATEEQRKTYRLASTSGGLLAFAMAVSFVECLVGFQHGFVESLWGFPWLHIVIHIAEQIGIYMYGVSVAALRLTVIPEVREGAKIQHLPCGLPYVYCP